MVLKKRPKYGLRLCTLLILKQRHGEEHIATDGFGFKADQFSKNLLTPFIALFLSQDLRLFKDARFKNRLSCLAQQGMWAERIPPRQALVKLFCVRCHHALNRRKSKLVTRVLWIECYRS